MTPDEFKAWRKSFRLTQTEAADQLGISRGSVELYEAGERRDAARTKVEIPKTVELACHMLAIQLSAEGANEFLATPWARNMAMNLAWRLNEPCSSISPDGKRTEHQTRHEALRAVGLIPEGELSVRERLRPTIKAEVPKVRREG